MNDQELDSTRFVARFMLGALAPMVLNDAGVIGFSLDVKSFPATERDTGMFGMVTALVVQ